MDFNDFKRKYGPAEEPRPDVGYEPDPPAPQPPAEPTPAPARAVSRTPTPPAPPSGKPAVSHSKVRPTADIPSQRSGSDPGGFFGENSTPVRDRGRGRSRRPVRSSGSRSVDWSRLSTLPWVDIIMITLTVIGIIWVIANFDAVTVIIAAGIGKLMQYAIGLICLVAVIALAAFIFRRRGRYPRWR